MKLEVGPQSCLRKVSLISTDQSGRKNKLQVQIFTRIKKGWFLGVTVVNRELMSVIVNVDKLRS